MGNPRHELGAAAERAVATWLELHGWSVLARRHRSANGGEVDLVALDPGLVLVAIEVRARATGRAGDGSETIDARRIARIGRTLVSFAAEGGSRHRGLRVDLVTATPLGLGTDRHWRLRRMPGISA